MTYQILDETVTVTYTCLPLPHETPVEVFGSRLRARTVSGQFSKLQDMSELQANFRSEPVHLTVDSLPLDVAQQLREAQSRNPDLLRQILVYGIIHKTVFETLSRSWLT